MGLYRCAECGARGPSLGGLNMLQAGYAWDKGVERCRKSGRLLIGGGRH